MESWPPLVSGVRMSGVGAAAVWDPSHPHWSTLPPAILLSGNYCNVCRRTQDQRLKILNMEIQILHGDKIKEKHLGRHWPLGHAYDLKFQCTDCKLHSLTLDNFIGRERGNNV